MPEPDDERRVVGYRAARDDAADTSIGIGDVMNFLLGFWMMVVTIFMMGSSWDWELHRPGNTTSHSTPVITFALVMVVGVVGVILAWRAKRRRWSLLGILTGIGVMGLLQGLCFFNR